MVDTLYVFANMGNLDSLPKSGGQTSARRVMKGLDNCGFRIIPICRHRSEWEGRWLHQIEILLFAIIDFVKINRKLLFARRKNGAFLHLTYAGPLVPFELLLTCTAKFLGYKSIIYLKGGQAIGYYENGSSLYRRIFKKTMDLQSKVFFEGMECLNLVKRISQTPLVYFPNYVFDDQIPCSWPNRSKDLVNLIYFGRISPSKNIHIIIDAFETLCSKHDNVFLTIIGAKGKSTEYVQMIDNRISKSVFASKITRKGITPFDEIQVILRNQLFFLFPTEERAEGHSNSLNEAMSQGVIPIVSDFNFNRSVVGDEVLVVPDYDGGAYAKKIEYILNECDINELSHRMIKRVKENYSYSVVNSKVCNEIKCV